MKALYSLAMTNPQYPICLILEGQRCLVVGGGPIAARKALELVRSGGDVTVISPFCSDEMKDLLSFEQVNFVERTFSDDDIEDCFIVVAATDDMDVNQRVADIAQKRRVLVNVVDQPDLCTFTAPAVVRRGPLTLTISTGGASPALSARLRRDLSEQYGPEWSEIIEELSAFRRKMIETFPNEFDFKKKWISIACKLDLVSIYRDSGRKGLQKEFKEIMDKARKNQNDGGEAKKYKR